ncbi:hypothetical protein [Pontibacter roseus]|uniref:hypothetical protein n=1 Tax=Pontibacter roseus TaxID=336989 RepID=UPI0003680ACA|nr:hypothetical protein [Pontibacter roseus]
MLPYLLPFTLLLQAMLPIPPAQSPIPNALFGQAFTVQQFNYMVLYDSTRQEDSKLVLSLGNVLDSRCPKEVLCIHAGQADLDLSISAPNGQTTDLKISYAGMRHVNPDSVRAFKVSLDGKTYGIRVLDVAPYPTAEGPQLPKRARLVVAKQ